LTVTRGMSPSGLCWIIINKIGSLIQKIVVYVHNSKTNCLYNMGCSKFFLQFATYLEYCISSYKTRGYYFFTRPSTAGIIRMRVLIEGWYYYQKFINLDIKTRKPANTEVLIIKIARFLHGVIKKKT
jgi:hypothetical protein